MNDNSSVTILICTGAGCIASGALEFRKALTESLRIHGLLHRCQVRETGCLGPCAAGPVALVYPDGTFYQKLSPGDAPEIVESHVLNGVPVERLIARDRGAVWEDSGFFRAQTKRVLRNCGVIDPKRIEEYIVRDGYRCLAVALGERTPVEVIEEIKASGLRGRGGAGFSTGMKWAFTRAASGTEKFVLCNADEGDPGAFMDRSILEGDPHSVIEGMIVAAYAIGASRGFVYVRAEYPLAVERLQLAVDQARRLGFLGKRILGADFDFDLELRKGSGAFVCGEETALMTSIEGNRGEPRPRPPFPAQKGLWGKPSLLNNVETYANVPMIILKGADWFASLGTEKSKGTKVFALAGAVVNAGLVEVPIGTPLGEIVYDIGGGIPGDKAFKAAQIGGPSGGCIPREHLNVPVDYESLTSLGAIMGSGGMIVLNEDSCMVDVARYFLEFVQEESCGKCVPCRVGTKRMLEILQRICAGRGEEADIERLERLGAVIKDTALCGLGQTAPNPVLSTIRHFREEYLAHIRDGCCPAGVCPDLVRAPCQNACPAGVDVPGFVSLIGEKRYAEALVLHRERNPFAAVCARVCFHPCENKCRRSMFDEPVSIRPLKRFMADQETTYQVPAVRSSEANAGRRVAIVGGGPSGLSCAYFLARLGYRPVVFEAEDRPGGMLVQGIPAYRLPREIVAGEIAMIEGLGVEIRTDQKLGRDFTLGELRDEGFEAIFLGVGAPDGLKADLPGDARRPVIDAIRFLKEHNLGSAPAVDGHVVVVGGGNSAVDAARTAVRLGAKSVTVLYRRTKDEMPAYAEEVEEAEREGVCFTFLVSPERLAVYDGELVGVTCYRMKLGDFDRSGRRRPVPDEKREVAIKADTVIMAIGQSLDCRALLGDAAPDADDRGFVKADPRTGRTSIEWLFAGGDAVTGAASVVEAVAAGERAAVAMDEYLTGSSDPFWREEREGDVAFDPDAGPVPYGRARPSLVSVAERAGTFGEVELALTEAAAVQEAKRCLRCDYREPCESERNK